MWAFKHQDVKPEVRAHRLNTVGQNLFDTPRTLAFESICSFLVYDLVVVLL